MCSSDLAGDRPSRLGDPAVVALAGETNRVPLLIGVDYSVTSDTPFAVSFPEEYMYVEVETNGPCAARVRWPLAFTIAPDGTGYRASAVTYDPGRRFPCAGRACRGSDTPGAVRCRRGPSRCLPVTMSPTRSSTMETRRTGPRTTCG